MLYKTFKGCLITLACLIAALGLWLFWATRPSGWKEMARMTGVQVPVGAVFSAVTHETEVEYHGTIELKSAADVAEFIRVNGLTPLSEHVVLHPWVKRGDVSDALTARLCADARLLMGHSDDNAWEFVLYPNMGRVRYVVLVPDETGTLPWKLAVDGRTPVPAGRGVEGWR